MNQPGPVNTNWIITVGAIFLSNKAEREQCSRFTQTIDNAVGQKMAPILWVVIEKAQIKARGVQFGYSK